MVPEKCQHPKRVRGVVELDFSRPEAPDHPVYSCELREVSPRALRLAKKELRTNQAECVGPQMPECDYGAGFHSRRCKFRSDLEFQPFSRFL